MNDNRSSRCRKNRAYLDVAAPFQNFYELGSGDARDARHKLERDEMHADIGDGSRIMFGEAGFRGLSYVRERLFNREALAVAAGERRVRGDEEASLVLLDDDGKVASVVGAVHETSITKCPNFARRGYSNEVPGFEDVERGGCVAPNRLHHVADAIFLERDLEEIAVVVVHGVELVSLVGVR
jgi:hypothetical protein